MEQTNKRARVGNETEIVVAKTDDDDTTITTVLMNIDCLSEVGFARMVVAASKPDLPKFVPIDDVKRAILRLRTKHSTPLDIVPEPLESDPTMTTLIHALAAILREPCAVNLAVVNNIMALVTWMPSAERRTFAQVVGRTLLADPLDMIAPRLTFFTAAAFAAAALVKQARLGPTKRAREDGEDGEDEAGATFINVLDSLDRVDVLDILRMAIPAFETADSNSSWSVGIRDVKAVVNRLSPGHSADLATILEPYPYVDVTPLADALIAILASTTSLHVANNVFALVTLMRVEDQHEFAQIAERALPKHVFERPLPPVISQFATAICAYYKATSNTRAFNMLGAMMAAGGSPETLALPPPSPEEARKHEAKAEAEVRYLAGLRWSYAGMEAQMRVAGAAGRARFGDLVADTVSGARHSVNRILLDADLEEGVPSKRVARAVKEMYKLWTEFCGVPGTDFLNFDRDMQHVKAVVDNYNADGTKKDGATGLKKIGLAHNVRSLFEAVRARAARDAIDRRV